ncbi:MAG: M20/M25/M40 family metallo-hydrolase [Bryobacteraceae bacterium]|nr:M20/M25/M40 family metallo-hydrolase [Bryobacteraceae bacterium]MDW8380431.1 M20/M25/M40 family metallo-hydrolase [Bryobacterales bacterium]
MKPAILALFSLRLLAAEPDWSAVQRRATEFLQQYLRVKSINPPGDVREAADLFRRELEKVGLAPKLLPKGSPERVNLLVRLKGRDSSKKPLLLLNHFDVVPVDEKAWRIDPFGGLIQNGFIWGRGAMDMKGTGVMHLFSLILLKELGITPARDIVMLCTPDEETAGVYGIRSMIRDQWPEIESEYVLDEGGFGSRDVFSPGKLVFGVSVGEKQVLWLRLRAKGTAGHGSQPIADNANLILLAALGKALAVKDQAKQNEIVTLMRQNLGGPLAQNKFTAAIERNTISLTTLTSGVGSPAKVNVIPSLSEATLDCRLLPGVNADEFESEMRARINDPRVTVERISHSADAGVSPHATPLFDALKAAILKYHPKAVVTPILIPYGTDSVWLRQKGVKAYGLTPMVLDAATVATMHSDEERIPLAEFHTGLRIFYEIVRSEF